MCLIYYWDESQSLSKFISKIDITVKFNSFVYVLNVYKIRDRYLSGLFLFSG